MTETAKRLLEWERTDGRKRSLILVTDNDRSHNDIDYRRLELCSFDPGEEKWKTDGEVDFINEITGFSIPENLVG